MWPNAAAVAGVIADQSQLFSTSHSSIFVNPQPATMEATSNAYACFGTTVLLRIKRAISFQFSGMYGEYIRRNACSISLSVCFMNFFTTTKKKRNNYFWVRVTIFIFSENSGGF